MSCPVQVNGRVRDRLVAARDEAEDVVRARALELENVKRHIEGKHVRQVVIVPNRIVNIIVFGCRALLDSRGGARCMFTPTAGSP